MSTTPRSTTTGAAAGRRWCSRTARSTTAAAGQRVAEALESEYDLIAYDARFHGKSDAPASGMRRGADDLVGVIEALGIERPYAIGHSMGAGTVASALAARPELIRAAVLEDPAWPEAPLDPAVAGSFMKLFADSLSGKSVDELVAMCAETSPTWDPAEYVPWAESKAAFRGSEVISGSGVGRDDWATPVRGVSGSGAARVRRQRGARPHRPAVGGGACGGVVPDARVRVSGAGRSQRAARGLRRVRRRGQGVSPPELSCSASSARCAMTSGASSTFTVTASAGISSVSSCDGSRSGPAK